MAVWNGNTKWRQGGFLAADAAGSVIESADQVAIVISHDCDLAQEPDVEPYIEIIVGGIVCKSDGNYTHAKNVRRLHLNCSAGAQTVVVDLFAVKKQVLSKEFLSDHDPDPSDALSRDELVILQRWLAARYYRSAFSNEFNSRLKATGIEAVFRKVSARYGDHIRGIFLEVEDDVERIGEDDPYTLTTILVYDTDHNKEIAEKCAKDASREIENAFAEKCRARWGWKNIELLSCEIVSDMAVTFRELLDLREWRSEHVSLKNSQPSMFNNRGGV
ncbi:MAG: hypothetical protein FWD68_06860 [Alphaproteobacteria bacterium]|nr:hypothetical protein [Alphaproteobacteria bacterium]